MNTAVSKLFKGGHHFGLAALLNLLHSAGFLRRAVVLGRCRLGLALAGLGHWSCDLEGVILMTYKAINQVVVERLPHAPRLLIDVSCCCGVFTTVDKSARSSPVLGVVYSEAEFVVESV